MNNSGKGDTPRPYTVDRDTFNKNWDAIFGKKEVTAEEIVEAEDKVKQQVNLGFSQLDGF